MIDLIAAAGIGGLIGFGVRAVLTAGKVGDYDSALATSEGNADRWASEYELADAAHTRCSDALATNTRRLAKIRELADSPQTIRKADVRAVLNGDV